MRLLVSYKFGPQRTFLAATTRRNNLMSPVLIHVHVPKCAGTSFRHYLDLSFPGRHVGLYVDQTSFVYSPELIRRTVLQDPGVAAISSHFIRLFPPLLGDRVPLYVTFLRDPVTHFVAYLTYIKKVFNNVVEEELRRCIPQDTPDMNLRDMAEWVLTRDTAVPFKENYQVNFFAEYAWASVSGYQRAPSQYGMSRWDPDQFARYRQVRLDLARFVLSNFFFVGLVEDIQAGVIRLREKCDSVGVKLAEQPIGCENSAREFRDDLSWLHQRDRVGKLLFESLQEDFELYSWVKKAYDSTVKGAVMPAVKWDRRFVTAAGQANGKGPVYLVVQGMRRLVRDVSSMPQLSGVPPQVQEITALELAEIPPGAPL
jgi:hypothetical protein